MKFIIVIKFAIITILYWGCKNNNDSNYVEASGTIEATNITISTKAAGEIKAIKFVEGQNISTVDTLVIIDSKTVELQLEQAIASKEIAEAQLKIIKSGARKEDIKQAEEIFNQAETNSNLIKKDYERNLSLFNNRTISQKQLDEVTSKFKSAQSQFNGAKENLTKVKKIFRDEELIQAESNLKKANASVELLKNNLKDCFILSPVNGIVVKKYFEKGEIVSPMASLLKISDLTTLNLLIYVSETELGKIKFGQIAEITVDAFPEKLFKGKIVFISSEAEFTPKNIQTKDERTKLVFQVKIEIANPNLELKAGMPADVKIKLNF